MDIQQQFRPPLEPIQEESEQEDEAEGSKTEGEEEDFQFGVGVETREVVAEEESDEDEDEDHAGLLRVMRARRLPLPLRQESFLQIQSTNNHEEEMENLSESDRSTHGVGLSDEASPPLQTRMGNEKSSGGVLRIQVSKVRWPKYKPPKPLAQKKKPNRKKNKKAEEPFPEWLVDLMVNIEEATTHPLVVE